jgi:predicted dehydrogenase
MNNSPENRQILRWGIIGTGRIANTFASDIKHVKNAMLYGVGARQSSSATTFAAKYSIDNAYGSYAALLADPNVDAIYIATPHTLHKEQSIAAMLAGKHVLCEKPATVTLKELEQVIDVAKQEQRYFMEGMWSYFLPVLATAQDWIKAGRIGKLTHVKADFGYPLPYSPDLREYDNRLGGGCLLEMGIYPIAMAWLFLGQDPDQQSVWSHAADNGVEDDVVILNAYHKQSATAQLSTSFRCKLPNYLYLIGDEGYIAIPNYWAAEQAKLYKLDICIDHFSAPRPCSGFSYQIEQVSNEILTGQLQPKKVSWAASLAFQRQIAAIKTRSQYW